MHGDAVIEVSGATFGTAEDVEVGQAGQGRGRGCGDSTLRDLSPGGVSPPTWVLHAWVVVRFRLFPRRERC